MSPDNDNIFLKQEIFEAKCEFPYDVNFFKEHVFKTTSVPFCSNIDSSLKWNLVVIPSGYDPSTFGSFCILLKNNNVKNDDINVLCQFYIMDENRKILFDDLLINVMFDKIKNMWGIKTYMSKDELLKECV
uniref:MATH domain-containing protein n=1 Tax=Strongyloides papillosus TaxID=174720 RepID=A0A0N5CIZ6_STREA